MPEAAYKICSRCVMDTSDPEISFDDNGHCNHCRWAEEHLRSGWYRGTRGLEKLSAVAAEIRGYGKNKEYDCIIGVSGGVDSSYLLHVAKVLMGLRPLAVHVDAGWNSEIAVKNIESLIKALDIDLFTYVVDWEEMKDLQLSFLEASVANQDIPQDHVFAAKLYEFAVRNNIRYVLTGSNLTSESILPASWGYDSTDRRHLLAIHRRFGRRTIDTYPTMSFFQYHFYWPVIRRMKRVAPLNYIDYDKRKAIAELTDTYGWRYYGGKHYESRWTKFFQSYYLPVKFGYDKRRAHLSSILVAGQVSRDEALAQLGMAPYDAGEIENEKDHVARKLGIDIVELERLIALPNRSFRDYPNNYPVVSALRKVKHTLSRMLGGRKV